jgi:hypothetical protein
MGNGRSGEGAFDYLAWFSWGQHATQATLAQLRRLVTSSTRARAAVAVDATPITPVAVPAEHLPPDEHVERVQTQECVQPEPTTTVAKPVTPERETGVDGRGAAAASTEGEPAHEATFALLSQLYGCDVAKEMLDMSGRLFTPVAKRVKDAPAQVIRVEVDGNALRRLTLTRTNLWVREGQHDKAEAALKAALAVWPGEATAIEYRLACSASLRGELATSLNYLNEAVLHGYHNVQQMKRDPDLANVRDHPDFSNVLRLAAKRLRESIASLATPTVVPVMPAVMENASDQLTAMFPSLTRRVANDLVQYFGSLESAVDYCLLNSADNNAAKRPRERDEPEIAQPRPPQPSPETTFQFRLTI